jgi:ABC-type Fe3+-siderophore transport system permease subunit
MKRNVYLSLVFFIALFITSLFVGSSNLFQLDKEQFDIIFYGLRLPRSLAIVFVGFALGISGFILQSILQNHLAEPYTLGISGGASVGVSIAILFSIYPLWLSLPVLAGVSCILVTILIFWLARRLGGWNQRGLILAGVILSYFCNSISYVGISALSPADLGTALKWLMGRFGEERDSWWPMMAASFFLVYIYLHAKSKRLEYYHLGEDLALSFTNKDKTRIIAILLVSLLTAMTVVMAGVVAFVGLIAPHLCLYLFKSVRYKHMLPMSALYGGILLLLSDVIARILLPLSDLPAGGIIAIFGTPFLLYLLIRGSNDSMAKL